MIVREGEILAILRYALSWELQDGRAIFDATADIINVLRRVQQRRVITADPSVHHESPTVGLVDPTKHRVGLRLKIQHESTL